MNGPEHYREAEKLIERWRAYSEGRPNAAPTITPPWLTEAQVHATLAATAAMAGGPVDRTAWMRVLHAPPEEKEKADD